MELNNIRLLVDDFDQCFKFYSETLGLEATWGKPGDVYASFNIGLPNGLSIFKSDFMAEAVGNKNKKLPKDHREKSVIGIKVENVDKAYETLNKKGIEFINKPGDRPDWGIRCTHFRDPEGNLFEIWSELPKDKWDKHLQDMAKDFKYK